MDLRGKVVLITGGARGIGAAVGAESARRGARVALAGLEPELLAETAAKIGPETHHVECDVSELESVEAAVAGTVERFGGIDVVLANAGIGTYGTAEKGDPQAWLRTVDINLNGAYRTLHATLPHVLERRGYIGVVCSIASFAPLAGMSSYIGLEGGGRVAGPGRPPGGRLPRRRRRRHPPLLDRHRPGPRERAGPAELPRGPGEAALAAEGDDLGRGLREGDRRRLRAPQGAGVRAAGGGAGLLAADADHERRRRADRRPADADERIPRMEREIAALGRPASARTAAINDLSEDERCGRRPRRRYRREDEVAGSWR